MFFTLSQCLGSPDASGQHPVRLADGPGDNAGRVEIYSGGKWGAVGDEGWDMTDGNVVCKELGFPEALEISLHLPANYVQVFAYSTSAIFVCFVFPCLVCLHQLY